METKKYIPYAHQSIEDEDVDSVTSALRQDRITRGAAVRAFEEEVASFTRSRFAVAFSNGSAALWAAFQAAAVGPSDRVITSPNTFIATVAGAVQSGARLRLVDIDPYGNMDLQELAEELSLVRSRGRSVIVPVHFAGVAIDMQRLSESISQPDTVVIEDAAHALGSSYPDGSPVGSCSHSDMTIFSFHATKNITCGEGGMVTTNSEDLYRRLRVIRDSGIQRRYVHDDGTQDVTMPPEAPNTVSWYYEVGELSCNGHMTEFQAALGRSQLRRLHAFADRKRTLLETYRRTLTTTPGVTLPPADVDDRTHRHLLPVTVEFSGLGIRRTTVVESLRDLGVGTQYHYVPLYAHPALQSACGQRPDGFPAMERHVQTSLSLPFFSSMTEEQVYTVVSALRKVLFAL